MHFGDLEVHIPAHGLLPILGGELKSLGRTIVERAFNFLPWPLPREYWNPILMLVGHRKLTSARTSAGVRVALQGLVWR